MKVGGMIGATLQVLRKNNSITRIKATESILTKGIRQDIVSIGVKNQSKSGGKSKTLDLIESLNEQIKGINESKNALVRETLEQGKDIKSIRPQLESFDAQIKNISDMITKINAEEQQKLEEKDQTATKPTSESEPKTVEDIESEKLNNVISLSAKLDSAEQISSLKAKTEAYARTVSGQIKMDGQLIYHHNDGTTEPISATPKEALLARLEQSIATMSSTVSQTLGEIQKDIDDTNSIKPSDEAKTDEATDDEAGTDNPVEGNQQNAKLSVYQNILSQTDISAAKANEKKQTFSAFA